MLRLLRSRLSTRRFCTYENVVDIKLNTKKEENYDQVIAFDSNNQYVATIAKAGCSSPLKMADGTVHERLWFRTGCVFLQNK